MPARSSKARSRSARSKSTEKKPARSRSVSRSRGRAKPKKTSSETKRPRSRSREISPNKSVTRTTTSTRTISSGSPRLTTRSTTKVETTTRSNAKPAQNMLNKFSSCIPCARMTIVGQYLCPVIGIFIPFLVFYLNCLIHTPAESSQTSKTKFGSSTAFLKAYIPTDILSYFDWRVHLVVVATAIKISIVTKYLKFGKRITQVAGGRRYEYCNNLWLAFFLAVLPSAVLLQRGDIIKPGFNVSTFLISGIPSIWASCLIGLIIDSFLVFRQSSLRASRSRTFGKAIQEFYYGRETRPMILGFDTKVISRRFGQCALFILIAAMTAAQYKESEVCPGLAFIFITVSVRIADAMMFEHKHLPFYHYQYDPCGFKHLMQGYISFPFLYSLMASFCYTHPNIGKATGSACDGVKMGISTLVFLLGYYIDRASENQKYAFRVDPHHPRFAGMDTIPTSSGRRLLAGGWFGLVRFPSYLGGFLMTTSWVIPIGCAYPWMWAMPVMCLVGMLCRIHEVEQHMASKHGSAFAKYKTAVPKRLIPRIL